MSVLKRNNVQIYGSGTQALIFAHGFGYDQNMWRLVAPEFQGNYRIVTFDNIGAGHSQIDQYDFEAYSDLSKYACDVLEICEALNLSNPIFVGHSVSAMIGVIAALKEPERFAKLVLIGPSPCYINDSSYTGGFDRTTMNRLLDYLDENYLAWARAMAPSIMGNLERPELGAELSNSFCQTNPDIARHFARVTFLSDNRADLEKLSIPTLILQCSDDPIAPEVVGRYVHSKVKIAVLSSFKRRVIALI